MYSVVPNDIIFREANRGAETIIQTSHRGHLVEAISSAEGCCISRVLSTDPSAYLDPLLQPGTKINGGY